MWRVGRKLGRTLYRDDVCVGMVDTRELAEEMVRSLNLFEAALVHPAPAAASEPDYHDRPHRESGRLISATPLASEPRSEAAECARECCPVHFKLTVHGKPGAR